MNMKALKTLTALAAILLSTAIFSCAPGRYLKTERAETMEIDGTYTLLLHGNRFGDDMETAAIFDKEGDPYTFEVFAPEYDYRVKKGIQAKEALNEAERFVGSHRSFRRSILSRIFDKEGNIIGYELRPLYFQSEIGEPDALYIDYTVKDNMVTVRIRLKEYKENRSPFLFR